MTRHVDVDVDRVDQLLARLAPPPPLSPTQVARVRRSLETTPSKRPVRYRITIAAIAAIVVGVATSAVAMYRRDVAAPATPPAKLMPAPEHEVTPDVPTRIATNVAPVVVAAKPPVPATPAPPPPSALAASPASPASAASVLAIESRLLATALRQLRHQRRPHDALATLDEYAARFAHGVLASEARMARIEALLALGDKQLALALLDESAVKSDLAVTRGELRLEAGRAAQALRDFDSALIGANDEIEQRALYGRAACRAQLGDDAAAKRDLEEYLRRFPRGKSAAAAQRALGR
jgi:hypothetical protein